MKKRTIITITLLFLSSFVFSQTKMRLGINIAPNYSNFYTKVLENNVYYNGRHLKFKIGYIGGVNFEYSIKDNLFLKTNLNYESKTFAYNSVFEDSDVNSFHDDVVVIEFKHNYIVLPLLIKYNIPASNDFFIYGGVSLNKNLNIKIKIEEDSVNDSAFQGNFYSDLSFGVGKSFVFSKQDVLDIEFRFNSYMINLNNKNSLLNKSFSLSLLTSWNINFINKNSKPIETAK